MTTATARERVQRLEVAHVDDTSDVPVFRVPAFGGDTPQQKLSAVEKYAHLGSRISGDRSLHEDAKRKTVAALTAHVPLAGNVFGNKRVGEEKRDRLAASPLATRLFNLAATIVPTQQCLRKLWRILCRARLEADAC